MYFLGWQIFFLAYLLRWRLHLIACFLVAVAPYSAVLGGTKRKMILVVGGFAQGKLAFAKETLGVKGYGDGCFTEDNCVYRLHSMVMQEGFEEALEAYLTAHPDAVLICDEVGCGIVPMEKADREYREKVGRVGCMLAKRASAVYRVVCGIGMRLV